MPYILLAGLVAYLVLARRSGWTPSREHPLPPLPSWPRGPQGPGPQGPMPQPMPPPWLQPPQAPAPPPPGCMSQQWHLPQQREIPAEVTERAKQLLVSSLPLGAQTVEQIGSQVWRFQVETHGANEMNPKPHRGVGVRLCV